MYSMGKPSGKAELDLPGRSEGRSSEPLADFPTLFSSERLEENEMASVICIPG